MAVGSHIHLSAADTCLEVSVYVFALDCYVPQRLTILILIKHGEHLLQMTRRYQVDVALVVAEQRPAYQRELRQR